MNKKNYTAIRQAIFNGFVFLLLMQAGQAASAADGGVEYRVAWDATDGRYHVYMRPTSTPEPDLSLTAQVTLRVPHATDGNRFKVEDLQYKAGTSWNLGSTVTAPPENPAFDYLSFIYNPVDVHAFAFKAGEEQEIFSFRNSGPCLGDVELMDNASDPFNQPPGNPANSAGTNPNNQFANAGWGVTDDNDYVGNYGDPATCDAGCGNTPAMPQTNSVYYRVAWQGSDQRYHVYMYPGSLPARNMSLTSQVTLKVPHSADADSFKATDIQSALSGVIWSESSRVNAPEEDASADYLSFTMNLTNSQAFPWQEGQELEVFSFVNSGACLGPVALMKNNDPFNTDPNSTGTNPGNQFTNLGWGASDTNNYAGNYGCPAVCIDPDQDTDNDGLTDMEEEALGTDINKPDTDNDDLTDKQEVELGTDPRNPDTDGDTLTDGFEFVRNSNPLLADVIRLQAKAMLQGAYDAETGLMRDDLRSAGLLPQKPPYAIKSVFTAGSQTMAGAISLVTGNDAPVDWVLLEIRDSADPGMVKAQLTGVVQRDGDIIDAQTGKATFLVLGLVSGDYYVSIHHRNHLAAMTAQPVTLGSLASVLDFSQPTLVTYGTNARYVNGSAALLWAGNTNADDYIIAQGPSNETNLMLSDVLLSAENTAVTTNYKLPGYASTDTNMDGLTIYAGPSNDIDLMMGNVLLHPVNGDFNANYIIRQQLP